jgi:hypothetical protein
MKRTVGLLFVLALSLMAADFWKKPFTQWSDKDVDKMMTDSPWAKSASVSMGGLPPQAGGLGGGGGFGHGGLPGGPQGGAGSDIGPGAPSFNVVARWETALPIRQALVRRKYGAEADKSADAGKILAEEERSYEIVLSGPLGPFLHGTPEESAKALNDVTALSSRRTGDIKPAQIEVSNPGRLMEVLFVFPRSMPFTADDKEVEFSTKLGRSIVRYKFKLKDMVFNGKLEM